jgi:hypothetical protein
MYVPLAGGAHPRRPVPPGPHQGHIPLRWPERRLGALVHERARARRAMRRHRGEGAGGH